ncbi:hypothetical protein BDK51DRAFT_46289 [Blyttiomyces helicus]|uniref:Uncharacterized protein n=1 Tax=Blyttiomyces helicus TaxID=388810 RepID=A0A4P9W7T6_9FUNG|nr:hypothetical protein BDK51DRAFT_46289 [Blyttiomyces helicus]|eukprot:RKO86216.1 hypothetical protein BDK51DRAFT_46289 [Blyttiomyces helicus]
MSPALSACLQVSTFEARPQPGQAFHERLLCAGGVCIEIECEEKDGPRMCPKRRLNSIATTMRHSSRGHRLAIAERQPQVRVPSVAPTPFPHGRPIAIQTPASQLSSAAPATSQSESVAAHIVGRGQHLTHTRPSVAQSPSPPPRSAPAVELPVTEPFTPTPPLVAASHPENPQQIDVGRWQDRIADGLNRGEELMRDRARFPDPAKDAESSKAINTQIQNDKIEKTDKKIDMPSMSCSSDVRGIVRGCFVGLWMRGSAVLETTQSSIPISSTSAGVIDQSEMSSSAAIGSSTDAGPGSLKVRNINTRIAPQPARHGIRPRLKTVGSSGFAGASPYFILFLTLSDPPLESDFTQQLKSSVSPALPSASPESNAATSTGVENYINHSSIDLSCKVGQSSL